MKKHFINTETGLLKAGWRILAFMVLFVVITMTGMMTVRAILGSLPKLSVLQFSILATTATLAVIIARKYLDKKSFVSLGLKFDRFAILDIISGVINSAIVMTVVYFMMLWSNLIEFNGLSWWGDEVTASAGFSMAVLPIALTVAYKLTVVAWWEEIVFRGYFLQNLIAGMGLKWAIIISSLVFGITHGINPDATVLGSLLIALLTPQLIYAYLKTGQLWLPIGLHLGWNFFQASVFGFASSGQVGFRRAISCPTRT